MILHLGVVDVPYVDEGGKTTGDIAEILEAKYHVMGIFYEQHKEDIARALEVSVQGALENLLLGSPIGSNSLGSAESEIKHLFSRFLESKEMDTLGYPGVPTQASLKGVSHRFKRKRGPVRPSFIDTGLYETNFAAWVD